ncbi:MAG: hypothetical protein RMI51_05430 [Aquificaceae bacterium]|nr:hypothetical protein [Aquificaceae bacterium]
MKKHVKKKRWFGYAISALWISSMAIAGFFTPYFIDNISFFKIRALHIEGLENIPSEVIVEEVRKLKNNWLFINRAILLKNINDVTNNSVSNLELSKNFSSGGVELKLKIEERKPIFTAIKDDEVVFFDKSGTRFYSPYIPHTNLIVYTHEIELINKNFENLKNLVDIIGDDLKEVYITNLATIAYTEDGVKITLPPLFLLNRNLVENVAIIRMGYNINLNIKEMEINTEGVVIIRGGEER